MDLDLYDQAFPFGFQLGLDRTILHVGPALGKLLDRVVVGRSLTELIDTEHISGFNPDDEFDRWCGVSVSFTLVDPVVRLSGSFLKPNQPELGLFFAGSIGPEEVTRLGEIGLSGSDFSPHDLSLEQARLLVASRRRYQETEEFRAKLEESQIVKDILHRKAHTDELTEVANRSAFVEALEQAVARTPDPASQLAVMIVDIDRFKSINDLHGHLAGDETLRIVAHHLTEAVGNDGLVARLGGDEFGILVPALPIEDDLRVIIDRIMSIRGQRFEVENAGIEVDITIGVVVRRKERSGNELLRHADIAMYEARRTHQQPVNIFNPTARRKLDIRRAIRRDLPAALAANEVTLVYQPEVDLSTGLATKLETFVRWDHGDFGLIDTGILIDEVERSQMIQELNRYVLRRATGDALRHFQSDLGPMGISVNVSPLSITDSLAAEVDQVLAINGFPAEKLTLEVTEVGDNNDMQRLSAVLHEVASIGVTIALDDFGTGHSSLKNLSMLPIGTLKMDGSFTSSTSSSRKALELVRATIRICQMLELPVVAEGVETAEHAHLFQAMGFQLAQGYYFGLPLNVEETAKLLGRRLPVERRRPALDTDPAADFISVVNRDS